MNNIHSLLSILTENKFSDVEDFINFAEMFLEFISNDGMQADIISQNESKYHFYQYKEDGSFRVTRPINNDIFIRNSDFERSKHDFLYSLENIRDIENEVKLRQNINQFVYTCQQSVGATLDAFVNANMAKKRNGNLFEILIRSIVTRIGIEVENRSEKIRIDDENDMSYQHDMVLTESGIDYAIGSLKTSSKDRLDKIFLDKFMYNHLNQLEIPHFAIFLNDVQRKGKAPKYGISSTFLPGHFKGYSIALNPLDGIYYFDLRPNMRDDNFLKSHIKEFDSFLVEDIWKFKDAYLDFVK